MIKGLLNRCVRRMYIFLHNTWILLPQSLKENIRKNRHFAPFSLWIIRNQDQTILKEIEGKYEKHFVKSIDVVVTSHKQSIYLEEALISVLNQTFQPTKIIVVLHDEDDQEKIKAIEILSTLTCQISIELISIPECWTGEARNSGAKLSQSDAIVFLDADDLFERNYLFNAILYMNYYNVDFVGSWCSTFGEKVSSEKWSVPFFPKIEDYVSSNSSPVGSLIRADFFKYINGWKDFDKNGNKIDEALDFWRRAKLSGGVGINVQNPFILLRRHARNRSAALSETKFFNPRNLKKQMKSYYKDFPGWENFAESELQLSNKNLRSFIEQIWNEDERVVILLIADAKAFGAGKVGIELLEKLNQEGHSALLINLDINGVGFGIEYLTELSSKSCIIELGSACPPNNWIQFLRQILIQLKVETIFSLGHPYANDLLWKLKSEQPNLSNGVFMFNSESLHAKWISSNPNTFDKLLLETTFAYEWALDQGWLPSRLEIIAHAAHKIGFDSIDIDQFKEVKGAKKILWYNRFASEKQPELFVKLAHTAQKKGLPFEFLMGGSGPLRSEIETAIGNLDLRNLHLLGEETSNIEALKISDFLIMTSSSVEGRPLICSEALESGLDLILPNLPNFSDFVTDGFEGIHIYSDFEDILTTLTSFDIGRLRDFKKQRAVKNRKIALDRTNLEHFLQRFVP